MESGNGSGGKKEEPDTRRQALKIMLFGQSSSAQRRVYERLTGHPVPGAAKGEDGLAVVDRDVEIDGRPVKVIFYSFSDELATSQADTFDVVRPLLQKPNDQPDALVFVYSLASRTSQEAMVKWSQTLAKLFLELTGAGPRYMFIGDLSRSEDAEPEAPGEARMSVDILHEGAQVKFFLTEPGKERELDDAFACFLKPLASDRAARGVGMDKQERERLLAEELKTWEREISGSNKSAQPAASGTPPRKSSDPRAQTWDEGSVRRRLIERYGTQRQIAGSRDSERGLGDIVQLEGELLSQLSPERRAWVRSGALPGSSPRSVGSTSTSSSGTGSPASPPGAWESCLSSPSPSPSSFLSEASARGMVAPSTSLPLASSTGSLIGGSCRVSKGRREELKRAERARHLRRCRSLEEADADDVEADAEAGLPDDQLSSSDSDEDDEPRSGGRSPKIPTASDKNQPATAASAGAQTQQVSAEVVGVLSSLGLNRYIGAFARPDGPRLDMASFLQLDDDELKRIGLPYGARKKLRSWQKKHMQQQGGTTGSPATLRRSESPTTDVRSNPSGSLIRSKSSSNNNAIAGDEPVVPSPSKRSFSQGIMQLKKKFSTIGPSSSSSASASDAASPEGKADTEHAAETTEKSTEKSSSRSIFSRKMSFGNRAQPPSLIRVQAQVKAHGVNHADDKTAATLLHKECDKEELDKEVIEYLVANGADLNAVDKDGWAPLHVLCKRKRVTDDAWCFRLLISSGAKAGLLTKDGASPLHYIVRRTPATEEETKLFARSLDALLEGGAPINGPNTHGETPLFHAIMHSNQAVFDTLVERKAFFNLANKAGATPLHFAVLAQKPEIVRRLLELGVSPQIGADHRMGSALELAQKQPGQKGKTILQMLQGRADSEDERRLSTAFLDPQSLSRFLSVSGDKALKTRISHEALPPLFTPPTYTYAVLASSAKSARKALVNASPRSYGKWELDHSELVYVRQVGAGAFGTVWQGKWHDRDVAIKKLHLTGDNPVKLEEFRNEARVMMALRPHPNLVQFLGLCSKSPNLCIVSEWHPEGDMLQLLRRKKGKLSADAKLKMAIAAATGVSHLHSENVLHNDLAARNLLVTKWLDSYDVKVSDFGLSTQLQTGTNPHSGPLKWMAPEALHPIDPKFSVKSDVWSFGVVLWEIFTDGAEPYEELSPEAAAREVMEGRRLTIPTGTPHSVTRLIERCWLKDRDARPSFQDICTELERVRQRLANGGRRFDRRPRRSTTPDDEDETKTKTPVSDALPRSRRRVHRTADDEATGSGGAYHELSPAVSQEDNSTSASGSVICRDNDDGDNEEASDEDDDEDSDADVDDGDEGADAGEPSTVAEADEADDFGGHRYRLALPASGSSPALV